MRFPPRHTYHITHGLLCLLFMQLIFMQLSGCDLICLKNCSTTQKTNTPNTEKSQPHDHSQHHHNLLEVTSFGVNMAIPSIDLSIHPDAMSGWNIQIQTKNFHFTPERINSEAKSNEGHAHIYIDNFKIARVYGNWHHLKKLTPGEHVIRVSLNANDHSEWAHKGAPIDSKIIITQN